MDFPFALLYFGEGKVLWVVGILAMLQQNPICEKVNICASNHNLQPKCDDSNSNGSAILRYYFVLVLQALED